MIEKIKTAKPYILILVLIALMVGFNSLADTVSTSVTLSNQAPTVGEVSMHGQGVTSVTLTEDTAIDIMATVSITDANGCESDVRDGGGVEAIFYTSDNHWVYGSGTTSSMDYNDTIDTSVTSCSWQSTAGNTCTYSCFASAAWYYYADATIGSTASKADEAWEVMVWASDSEWADTSTTSFEAGASNQAEITLLTALTLEAASQSIAYDNSAADSDSTILERGIRNSGNRGINPQIKSDSASGLCDNYPTCSGDTIAVGSQQYSASTFTLGVDGTSLSAALVELDLALSQRTNDTDPSDDQIFWGLHVPAGQAADSYTGINSYTAVAD